MRITRQCEYRDDQGRCHKSVYLSIIPSADTRILCRDHIKPTRGVPGRPSLYDEPVVNTTVRIPISLYQCLTSHAQSAGTSLSALVVAVLREWRTHGDKASQS